jgi:hypothetical protein
VNDATSPVPMSISDDLSGGMTSGGQKSRASDAAGPDLSLVAAPDRQIAAELAPPRAGREGNGATRPPRVPVECGDLPFLIRRDGTWLYRDSPIQRKELVCLFASVLRRDEDGGWWLRTPAERGRIEVEDAPFVAVELDWAGDGREQVLSFRTNTDEMVTVGPDHPLRRSHDILTCEPTPYGLLRPGDGAHCIEARVNRAVYYELVALGVPEYVGAHLMLGVWSSGSFFPLGFMPDEDGDDGS